jgi:hypothetical protein
MSRRSSAFALRKKGTPPFKQETSINQRFQEFDTI